MNRPVDVFINRLSGTVLSCGEEEVASEISSAFDARLGSMTFVDPADLRASIQAWLEKNGSGDRALIVGGGDGTCHSAVTEVLRSQKDIVVGVLPLGTHNLFSRQLGFAADFRQAVHQYKNTKIDTVEIGRVNGHYFLCGVLVDHQSTIYYAARESLRRGEILSGLYDLARLAKGIFIGKPENIKVTLHNGTSQIVKGHAIAVTNNLYKPLEAHDSVVEDKPLKRVVERALNKENNDHKMGVYAMHVGIKNSVSLIKAFLDGTWTRHPGVTTVSDSAVTLSPVVADRKSVTIALDGETKEVEYPLQFSLASPGLKVYRPVH